MKNEETKGDMDLDHRTYETIRNIFRGKHPNTPTGQARLQMGKQSLEVDRATATRPETRKMDKRGKEGVEMNV